MELLHRNGGCCVGTEDVLGAAHLGMSQRVRSHLKCVSNGMVQLSGCACMSEREGGKERAGTAKGGEREEGADRWCIVHVQQHRHCEHEGS